MLNKYARAFFTRVLTPFAAFLIRRGVSPDAVTLLGTAGVVAGALVFFPRGEFFWGTIVITLFVFSDLVDGNMARQLGRTSRWGAFLDSTLDRVADGAIFGGLALWYAGSGDDNMLCAVSIFCLASGQVVSYTKARGEAIGLPVAVNGLVERAERLVITLVAMRPRRAAHVRCARHPGPAADRPVGRRRGQPRDADPADGDRPQGVGGGRRGVRRRGLPGERDRIVSNARERLVDALYGAGWSTVKKLPEPVAVHLGRTIADLTWRRRGKSVLRLESNLARVVPDASPERLKELSKAGMRSYLRYWMESFRLPSWSADRVRNGFDIDDVHHLTDGLASDKGVILALPHLGNWDLAGAWVTTELETPFTTVAERLKPETLYDRFVAYRESLGMEVLPHEGGSAFGTLARRLRGRRPGLPGRRPRSVRVRRRGEVLRRHRAHARGPGDTRPADRRPAPPGHPLVRRVARHARTDPRPHRGARDRYPRRKDVCHDAGAGRRLRHRDRRPPGGLAHAAATLAR